MRVLWLERAEADLRQIIDYLEHHESGAGQRVNDLIRSRTELLADFPGLGRPGRVPGTRELAIARTPYVVAYTVDRIVDAVIVLCVLHGARLWPDDL